MARGKLSLQSMERIKMKIIVIGSGSSGNCTYVELGDVRFLVDAGINYSIIENELKKNKISLNLIDFILITHTHHDHIMGLRSILKKHPIKVFCGLQTQLKLEYIKNYAHFEDVNEIKNLKIYPFLTSHDIDESYGFVIENEKESVAYLTDTGYVSEKIKKLIQNKKIYILESNHDVEMLMSTNRSHHLKMRILGDKGHLSNHDAVNCLCQIIGEKTKKIILVHLSEEANSHEKVMGMIEMQKIKIPVVIASKLRNELIEL